MPSQTSVALGLLQVIEALEFFIEANPPKWKQWKEKAKLPLKEN